MVEARSGVVDRIDQYFRRRDTALSRVVEAVSPQTSDSYLNNGVKRTLDVSVSVPAAMIVAPLVAVLGIAKKVEDGGPVFFTHERVSSDGRDPINLIKIRCMKPNSDLGAKNLQIARGFTASQDPRNTRLGSFMRRFQLEELPQLLQVALGKISLIGIRPTSSYSFDHFEKEWSPKRYKRWKEAYNRGPLGLSGVTQVFGSPYKIDEKRFHPDVFYVKKASLGFDLYLMWKTFYSLFLRKH